MKGDIYQFELNNQDHEKFSLEEYRGKTFMIVNVTSDCTMTYQDKKLEKLYQKYKDQGLHILAIPSSNFNTVSGQNLKHYSFPVAEEVSVRGKNQHPLYDYLTHEAPEAVEQFYSIAKKAFIAQKMDEGMVTDVLWNYEKFLIGKDGEIIQRFSSEIEPDDSRIARAIEGQILF
ncbi:hypothetical protein C0V70_12405 [Bacteriovorax stolpii]|uniref:Glutathione peroxidase n=1 Tax=Bacteriovorax stolpii TaxID=960 RepID=A0A2K9NTP1_BACTC|nr:redoxin domain-containing protein [Bacteriovorax stolpii]AUN98890.1 hypothetical protein C0V70_12405 [Bacteriovorax stolpii]TDP55589.1 glutathione peroxidase [Bacteriovorax stolpii]